jgi:hypothetical protein
VLRLANDDILLISMQTVIVSHDYLKQLESRVQWLEEFALRRKKSPPASPEELQEMHTDLVIKLGQEAEQQGITEEQLVKELRKTRKKVFAETYGDIDF